MTKKPRAKSSASKSTGSGRKRYSANDNARITAYAEDGFSAEEIGQLVGRTGPAIHSQASKLGTALDGITTNGARRFLKGGGFVLREELRLSGNVVVFWTSAHRSAECDFPTNYCEAMLREGWLVPAVEAANTYRLKDGFHG